MNIYVGNLSSDVSEDDLRGAFEAFGQVISVNIVKDKVSGESRGFGFVQMPSRSEALAAIGGMNNKDLKGQNVNVAEARPKAQSRRSSTGRRGGFGDKRRGGRGGFGGDRGGGREGFGGGRGKRRY
jgi:RNA recognition motif-containing protein